MSAGITIINNDNKLVVDENYMNIRLSRKIPISSTGTFEFSFEENEFLGAIGGDNGTINAYCENGTSSCNCIVNEIPTTGLTLYIFSMEETENQNENGIQVYNSNGKIIFDSGNLHGKIIKTNADSDKDISSFSKIAIACGCPSITYAKNVIYNTSSVNVMFDVKISSTLAASGKQTLSSTVTYYTGVYNVVKGYINYKVENKTIVKKVRDSAVVSTEKENLGATASPAMASDGTMHYPPGSYALNMDWITKRLYLGQYYNYYSTTLDVTSFIVFNVEGM